MKEKSLKKDLQKIVSISKKYGAEKVFLFGSCVDDIKHARDIDIAVQGIKPRKFFEFYSKVFFAVKDEVDIIDLRNVSPYFTKCVNERGRVLYASKIWKAVPRH